MVRNVFVCVFVYTETKKKEKESSIQCIVITSENIENFQFKTKHPRYSKIPPDSP